jgi:hypothetical protein
VGLGLVVWTALDPRSSVPPVLIFFFGLAAAGAISIVLHELAHFLVGRWLKLKPFYVVLGCGNLLFEKPIGGVTWSIRALPTGGYVVPLMRATGIRNIAFIAAGPAINLICLIVSARGLWKGWVNTYDWLGMPLFAVFLINICLLWLSLTPRSHRMDGRVVHSDGKRLLESFAWGSQGADREVPAKDSTADNDLVDVWRRIVDTQPAPRVLALYRENISSREAGTRERLLGLDLFATAVLMYGATDWLREADRYSRELYEAKPDVWTIKGTRGAVLIELGDLQQGIKMLTSVFENSSSEFDKAISAAYLALGELRKGDPGKGRDWLEKSGALRPDLPIFRRVERMFGPARI